MRLLVATTNPNKVREIRGILADIDIELVGLDAFPAVAEPEETGSTFAENARAKAVYYSNRLGVTAVAEDSGFVVDALHGEPGIMSARFCGPQATYPDRFTEIYRRLREHGTDGSAARFVCALAVARGEHVLFEARGTIEGRVADAPSGDHGFGYDPIFFYPPLGRTLAEISDREKAMISHRGQAFRRLGEYLRGGDVFTAK
jgi:XTP/dITP diphosphohydrolase